MKKTKKNTEKFSALDAHSTKDARLYGGALSGDGLGCQDYAEVKLEGARIVEEQWLKEIYENHKRLQRLVTNLDTIVLRIKMDTQLRRRILPLGVVELIEDAIAEHPLNFRPYKE